MCSRTVVPMCVRLARSAAELLFFSVLAILSTSPLLLRADTHIPQGTEQSATVPLLNVWTIWWNVDRIEHAYQDYWDAPIYYPTERMLASVEPQTVAGLIAWPLWHVLPSAAAVYNVLILLFLTLNGWFACRLLQYLRLTWTASLGGGAMMSLLPLVHWQLGVLQLVAVWGVIWTLWALLQFRRRPGLCSAAQLAVAFAITYSLCCYYGLMLSLLLLICLPPLFGRRLAQWQVWGWGLFSVGLALLILAPIWHVQLRFVQEHGLSYPREWTLQLSAMPLDYLRSPWPQLFPWPDLNRHEHHYPWPLSPGTLKLCMALAGIGFGLWTRRRRHVTLWWSTIAAVAMLLSLGPRLGGSSVPVYPWLAESYPGLAYARNVFRFAFFVQMAVALLAAVGLHGFYVFLKRWKPLRRRRHLVSAAVLGLGILLACEIWPPHPVMYQLPDVTRKTGWISWVRSRQASDARLAFFPLPKNNTATALQPTAEWMYFQTYHGRPMVNGYATFVPNTFRTLQKRLETFPSAEGVEALRAVGATHVVVDRRLEADVHAAAFEDWGMTPACRDQAAGMDIWTLPGPTSEDPVLRKSTRVTAAATAGGQTSIDPKVIEPWLGPNVLKHRMIYMAVGEESIEAALKNYDKHQELYVEFSPYNHLDGDDPPLFMSYGNNMKLPSLNAGHGIHHPVYGLKLKQKADRLGHECHLVIPAGRRVFRGQGKSGKL